MKSGSLRHRVTLQSPAGTRDAVGERQTTWTNVAAVWANVRPLSAKELSIAAQQQSAINHAVEIRYSSAMAAVTAAWRVLHGSRVLVIDGVINRDERNQTLVLYCTEGLRDE